MASRCACLRASLRARRTDVDRWQPRKRAISRMTCDKPCEISPKGVRGRASAYRIGLVAGSLRTDDFSQSSAPNRGPRRASASSNRMRAPTTCSWSKSTAGPHKPAPKECCRRPKNTTRLWNLNLNRERSEEILLCPQRRSFAPSLRATDVVHLFRASRCCFRAPPLTARALNATLQPVGCRVAGVGLPLRIPRQSSACSVTRLIRLPMIPRCASSPRVLAHLSPRGTRVNAVGLRGYEQRRPMVNRTHGDLPLTEPAHG